MGVVGSLFRNTFFSIFTNLLNRLGNTLLFIFIVQRLGVSTGGIYNLAIAYFYIGSRFAFWGLDHLLTREVAKAPEMAERYLSNFIFARGALAIGVASLLTVAIQFADYDSTVKVVIIIILIGILPESINNLCWGGFAAFEEYHLSTIGTFLNAVVKVSLGYLIIIKSASLMAVAIIVLIGHSAAMIINLTIIRYRYLKKWHAPEWVFLRTQLRIAYPFVFISVFFILDNRLDNLLLSFMSTEEAIGLYGAAMAVITALNLVPEGYRVAIFPIMSRYQKENTDVVSELYNYSLKFLLLFGVPLSCATFLMAEPIIRLIYGDYLPEAVLALRIMGLPLTGMFVNMLNTRLLIVCDRQDLIAKILMVTTIVNFTINILLLPQFGAVGAAIGRASSLTLMFILSSWIVLQNLTTGIRLNYLGRLFMSAIVMSGVVWWSASYGIWIQTIIGSLVYIVLVFVFDVISVEEFNLVKSVMGKLR